MDTTQLDAQLRQAEAQLRRAIISVDTAKSLVAQREAERKSATAVIAQRNAELDTADRKLQRSEQLIRTNAVPQQVLDDDRAAAEGAKAAVAAAEAQRAAAEAAISSAQAQVVDAEASIDAARAAIESIKADINDSTLMTPRDGRVQFRVAQPGEVLSAGGRVLNLVDLGDVYMTFFLPTAHAGRVAIGSEVAPRARRRAAMGHSRQGNVCRRRRAVHAQDGRDRRGAAEAHVPHQGAHSAGAAAETHRAGQDRPAGHRLTSALTHECRVARAP